MNDPTRLTAERLRELLHYDPETGIFTWIARRHGVTVGSIAGVSYKGGYTTIKVDGMRWLAHRLAWLYMTGTTPEDTIDHINCKKGDNRWENLRQATTAENGQNQRLPMRTNKVGFLGVSLAKSTGKYAAYIKLNGKSKNLGYYNTPEEAHSVYVEAKRKLHPFGTL